MSAGKRVLSQDGLNHKERKFTVPIWRFCKNDICLSYPAAGRFNEFVDNKVGWMKRRNLMFSSGFLMVLPNGNPVVLGVNTDWDAHWQRKTFKERAVQKSESLKRHLVSELFIFRSFRRGAPEELTYRSRQDA